jgi:hypothetical protein
MFTSDWFGWFVSALLGLSAIACATVLFGGWCRYVNDRAQFDGWLPAALPMFSLGRAPFAGDLLDVAAEVRDVLQHMAPEAARGRMRLEMAVQPDLAVHADKLALRTLLGDLVRNAMMHAPAGQVLLSAARFGGRVEIAVTDDGAGTEAEMRQAALREAGQLVALHGGSIHIDARPGEGTTVLVRLPEPMGARRAPGEASVRQPGRNPIAVAAPSWEAVAEHSWEI